LISHWRHLLLAKQQVDLHIDDAIRYSDSMNDAAATSGRDRTSGRFIAGNSGNGGRKPGARGKFSDQFIQDLAAVWQDHGVPALLRVAVEEPAQFLRVCVALMPRDVNLSLGIDASAFARTFQDAVALLGNEVPARQRPLLPNQKIVEHQGKTTDADHRR
jgi:hypothetical protein